MLKSSKTNMGIKIIKFFSKKEITVFLSISLILVGSLFYLYFCQKDIFIDIFDTSIYYRLDRISAFKNQDNMQVNNALISIGSGKLLYFPEANNDFFFAYLLSKNYYNFYLIIISYFLICTLFLLIKTPLSNLFLYILLFQVTENIGMNFNLLPVIGIPLPFLSYGGSHTITTFLMLGLGLKKFSNNRSTS